MRCVTISLLWIASALIPSTPVGAEGILRSERAVRKSRVVFPEISTKSECEKKAGVALERTKKVLSRLGSEGARIRSYIAFERSRETGLLQCALNFESFSAKYVLVEMESVNEYADRGENCAGLQQYFAKNPWVLHYSRHSGLTPQAGGACSIDGLRVATNPGKPGDSKAQD